MINFSKKSNCLGPDLKERPQLFFGKFFSRQKNENHVSKFFSVTKSLRGRDQHFNQPSISDLLLSKADDDLSDEEMKRDQGLGSKAQTKNKAELEDVETQLTRLKEFIKTQFLVCRGLDT